MENFYENYLKNEKEQNFEENEEVIQENDEKKSKILFNEIIDDLIRKKTSKENMLKIQIEKNKKNLLEKFYSLSNLPQPTIPPALSNIQPPLQNPNKEQKKDIIPNNINPLMQEGQKEYDEMREKYKNERNKKKSSIFKSEDLHISNTNSVHLKKEDYSPINPNMVNQETKNNILIIQKKLFGDNEEASKVENIDEIDDLDFDDIDIKDFKNNNNFNNNLNENNLININNENVNINDNSSINNNNNNKMSNSNFNLTNLDTNNINFDLSSNIKSEIMNENNPNEAENNFFPNEILQEIRAVQYAYIANKKKTEKIKEYKKQINRTKNFSVQLVSKLDYYREEEKDDNNKKNCENNTNDIHKYKKRKTGSEQREVMNEMNDLIKNLNLMNPNMNNNININNINNNININHANLADIITHQEQQQQQQKINSKKNSLNKKPKMSPINNNNKKNSGHYISLNNNNYNNINNTNYNTATTTNTTANKTNNISSSKKNNYSTNINNINNNPIISSKTPNAVIGRRIKPSYKKVVLDNNKPLLNNLDLNLNENVPNLQKVKTKAQIKINYRHISNSNLTHINSNNNSNKRKRKNNSVIINNSNKRKDSNINFYHFNTNTNNSNNNSTNNTNDINILKNNIKNIINQIPSMYKNNPLTTKNKKISMANLMRKKNNLNNNSKPSSKNKNNYNNINISTGNKFSTLNTIQKNNLIKFYRANHQIEAINKLKQQTYLSIYFIYAEKIKDNFLFKGIYKKSVSDLNYICNKVYSGPSAPICLNYEKFLIFEENNKMELIQTKLSSISVFNLNKTIILVKN